MTVLVYPTPEDLAEVTVARLCVALADAAAHQDAVHLAVAGGSVGTNILTGVSNSPLAKQVDWSRVHMWWVDERFVPLGHTDRNDAALDEVFSALPFTEKNIHRMPSPDSAASASEGAKQYAQELAEHAPEGATIPMFDIVLLGMGPDGHIASLFPHHDGLKVDEDGEPSQVTFEITDSPKPPAERISFSLPAVNHTRKMWVAAWGAEKAPAIAQAIKGVPVQEIPAAGIGGQEELLWLTDLAGAEEI